MRKLSRNCLFLTSFLLVISASQRVIRSSMSSPASFSKRRTAESVTSSPAMAMGRMCRSTSFCTYFILLSSGSFRRAKTVCTIFAPTKLWLWKVHPAPASQRFVRALPMSWSSAAQRSHSRFSSGMPFASAVLATLSATSSVWKKLFLWPRPLRCSVLSRAVSSGRMISSKPQRCSSTSPLLGTGARIILFSSSAMRSLLTILIRSLLRARASNVSSSMKKFSCAANLTQRIILRGSSEKVMSGSSGVRMMPSSKS